MRRQSSFVRQVETIETVCMSQQGYVGNIWVKNKQCKEHTYEATSVNKNIKPYVNWIKQKNQNKFSANGMISSI